jgi:hypothetical protein
VVIEALEDMETIPRGAGAQWTLVGQVTGNTFLWDAVVKWLQQRGIAARVMETICSDSYRRQEQPMALAHQADCCLVVDDGGGATVSLLEVLSAIHDKVYRVRWHDDGSWKASIDPTWLTGAGSVAVGGASLCRNGPFMRWLHTFRTWHEPDRTTPTALAWVPATGVDRTARDCGLRLGQIRVEDQRQIINLPSQLSGS